MHDLVTICVYMKNKSRIRIRLDVNVKILGLNTVDSFMERNVFFIRQ